MSSEDIQRLTRLYREGASVDELARRYEVHRTTVVRHLDRQAVTRRRVVRTMTDHSVGQAAARYAEGTSLAAVAQQFGIHERTLAREFRRAGVQIRQRNGWPPN